jgi:hypothetical protein
MKKKQGKIPQRHRLSIQRETLAVLSLVQLGTVTGNGSGSNCITQSKDLGGCDTD